MNLLLFVPLLVVGAPMPPAPVPMLAIVPPAQTVTLTWNPSPTPGCSNVVYWGEVQSQMTNRFEVGQTNVCYVNVDSERRYFLVRAVKQGVEAAPSNTIKLPGNTVRKFFATLPDGQTVELGTTTNTPPGASGFFRVNYSEWKDYTP